MRSTVAMCPRRPMGTPILPTTRSRYYHALIRSEIEEILLNCNHEKTKNNIIAAMKEDSDDSDSDDSSDYYEDDNATMVIPSLQGLYDWSNEMDDDDRDYHGSAMGTNLHVFSESRDDETVTTTTQTPMLREDRMGIVPPPANWGFSMVDDDEAALLPLEEVVVDQFEDEFEDETETDEEYDAEKDKENIPPPMSFLRAAARIL